MITIEEIPAGRIQEFFDLQMQYLTGDEIITSEEDITYFQSPEYRDVLKGHMQRTPDTLHMVYFVRGGIRIGASSYCTYKSEDGKCFILDYWVFPRFRGGGTGHRCFEALEQYAREDGAEYFMLNSTKEESICFWKSVGFIENGRDEYDMLLLIKK